MQARRRRRSEGGGAMKSTNKRPKQKVIVIGGRPNNLFGNELCRLCGAVFKAGTFLFNLQRCHAVGYVCYDCAENSEKIPARILEFAANGVNLIEFSGCKFVTEELPSEYKKGFTRKSRNGIDLVKPPRR
jgi:hypothetical protein